MKLKNNIKMKLAVIFIVILILIVKIGMNHNYRNYTKTIEVEDTVIYYQYLPEQKQEKYPNEKNVYIVCFTLKANHKDIRSANITGIKNFDILSDQLDDEEKQLMDKIEKSNNQTYLYYVITSDADISQLNKFIIEINDYEKVVDVGILVELEK